MAYKKKIPIVELDKPNGKPVAYWPSSLEASKFYNIKQPNISYVLTGKLKQTRGRYFRYATTAEIEEYNRCLVRLDETPEITSEITDLVNETEPAPPAEVIPETIIMPDNQSNMLSPFEQMLQKSKNKFNEK